MYMYHELIFRIDGELVCCDGYKFIPEQNNCTRKFLKLHVLSAKIYGNALHVCICINRYLYLALFNITLEYCITLQFVIKGFGGRTVIPSAHILRMERSVNIFVNVILHTVIMSAAVLRLRKVSLSTNKYNKLLKSNCISYILIYLNIYKLRSYEYKNEILSVNVFLILM